MSLKYVIQTHDRFHSEYIVGGTYVYQGEKYAVITEFKQQAKRYSSYKIAYNAMLKYTKGCVNLIDKCEVMEVDE